MLERPTIRQLGLGELLDETFRLYRNNFLLFMVITACIYVPYFIINYFVQLPFQRNMLAMQQQLQNPAAPPNTTFFADIFGTIAWFMVGSLLLSLIYIGVFLPLMEGALSRAVARRYLRQPVSISDSFGGAMRRLVALIGARALPLVAWLLVFGIFIGIFAVSAQTFAGLQNLPGPNSAPPSPFGLLAVIFGGFGLIIVISIVALLLGIRLWFTSQIVMIEGLGPWASIQRSWNLTRGMFWRTLGYLLVVGLLVALLGSIPAAVINYPVQLMLRNQPELSTLIASIVGTIFTIIATPFSLIAYTLMYYDLRIRKEGFDLEQQTNAMFGSSGAPGWVDVR